MSSFLRLGGSYDCFLYYPDTVAGLKQATDDFKAMAGSWIGALGVLPDDKQLLRLQRIYFESLLPTPPRETLMIQSTGTVKQEEK